MSQWVLGGCNLSGYSRILLDLCTDGFGRILPDFDGCAAASQTLREHDVFGLCPLPLYPPPPCRMSGLHAMKNGLKSERGETW